VHLSIGYVYAHVYVGEQYPLIVHQWDMWHGSKNLGKKITAVDNIVAYLYIENQQIKMNTFLSA
jgi:hypothetical protein